MGLASGLYSIDSNDWFDVYGFFVKRVAGKGKDAFLKFFDAKEPALKKDWPDQNGTEYDLTERFFKEKEIIIDGVLMGTGYADFWAKHNAMQALFAQGGTRRMYVKSLGRSFYVFYDSCTDCGTLGPLNQTFQGMIGCAYTFKFIEPAPSFWQPFSYLTDINGDYITTTDGSKILITT